MQTGGATAHEQHSASPSSSAQLPIVPRIGRTPRVDLGAILWPLERAARTSAGRTVGRALIAGMSLLALVAFALFNVRTGSGSERSLVSAPPVVTRAFARPVGSQVSTASRAAAPAPQHGMSPPRRVGYRGP
jgi:hypothetical protein